MENLTLEQLEQAQETLISRTRQARGDRDYLTHELSRLLIGNSLGTVTHDEIKKVRQQITESIQVTEETPAALAVLKVLIEQVRNQEAQERRNEERLQTLQTYTELRQSVLSDPALANTNDVPGRLIQLSTLIGGTGKGSYYDETRRLIESAREYNSKAQPEPFSFEVLIPERG